MIKVLLIAPYQSMEYLVNECLEEFSNIKIDIKVANLEAAIPLARLANKQDYDVIISRGGTAELIKKETDLPVIDVQVSGYDILRVVTLVNEFSGKKAIVGFSNVTSGTKLITDILELPINVYTVHSASELKPIIKKLKEDDYNVVIGDVVTVNIAEEMGIKGILLQSGKEAILDAINQAINIHSYLLRKQKLVMFFRSIIEKTNDDLIVFNSKKEVVYSHFTQFVSRPISSDQLFNYVQPEKSHVFKIDNQIEIKVSRTSVEISEEKYDLFRFEKLLRNQKEPIFQIQSVSQMNTLFIENHYYFEEVLSTINNHKSKQKWIFIGEKGTGKEIFAQYIHHQRYNGKGLIAKINIVNITENLPELDSDVSTIYIFVENSLSIQMPPCLESYVDKWIKEGKTVILGLREDNPEYGKLTYAKDSVRVYLPPLRERKEAIRSLATHFIALFHQELGTSPVKIKENAVQLLTQYDWPGNITEFKACIQDAVIQEKSAILDEKQIDNIIKYKTKKTSEIPAGLLEGTLEDIEKKIIKIIMEEEDHNQTKVAKRLNINRTTLWRKLKK
jgi:transcriptional regulator, propionate catabolism operon regulatory protein